MKKLLIGLFLVAGLVFAGQAHADKASLSCSPAVQTVTGPFYGVYINATNKTGTQFIAPSVHDYLNYIWSAPGAEYPTYQRYYVFYTVYPLPGTYTVTVTDTATNLSANCEVIVL